VGKKHGFKLGAVPIPIGNGHPHPVYFCKLRVPEESITKKLIVLNF